MITTIVGDGADIMDGTTLTLLGDGDGITPTSTIGDGDGTTLGDLTVGDGPDITAGAPLMLAGDGLDIMDGELMVATMAAIGTAHIMPETTTATAMLTFPAEEATPQEFQVPHYLLEEVH